MTISGNLFGLLRNFDDDPEMDGSGPENHLCQNCQQEKETGFSGPGFLSEIRGVIRRGGYEELDHGKGSG
ncbi:MAG: hypothetical protein MZV63_02520 [Marinilabiliales bacterium]|nr:hypothetical protein [Marinilabiliales bacterium]